MTPTKKARVIKNFYRDTDGRCPLCGQMMMGFQDQLAFRDSLKAFEQAKQMGRAHLMDKPIMPSTFPTVDHIKELRCGGTDRYDNLRVTCGPCNQRRSNGKQQKASQ